MTDALRTAYTPQEVWDRMLEPCAEAGCEQPVSILDGLPFDYGIIVQHGPNPEHRITIDAVCTMRQGQSNYLTAIRDWLTRVHSPRVWETTDD